MQDWRQRRFLAGESIFGKTGGLTELGMSETLALAVENQFVVVDEGHAVGVGELLCARTNEIDVWTFFEDQTGGLNGVAKMLDTGHAASFHAVAVHEEGIELHAAIGGQKTATAGIEGGIVFEDSDGGFDSIESRAALRKNVVAGFKRIANTDFMGSLLIDRDGPGTAVNEKSGRVYS